MALATKCPHCNTIFRVAADQLKLRGGIVRCGSCQEIFDGNAALLDPAALPAPAHEAARRAGSWSARPVPGQPAAAPLAGLTPVPSLGAPAIDEFDAAIQSWDAKTANRPPSVADDDGLDFDLPPDPFDMQPKIAQAELAPHEELGFDLDFDIDLGPDIAPAPVARAAAPLATLKPEFEPLFEPEKEFEALPEPTPLPIPAPAAVWSRPEPELPLSIQHTDDGRREPSFDIALKAAEQYRSAVAPDDQPDEPAADTAGAIVDAIRAEPPPLTAMAIDGDAAATPTPPEPGADDEPGFVRLGRRRQRSGKTMRILLGIGSAALLLAFMAQTVFSLRNQLATHMPQWKPALVSACAALGCRIELPTRIDLLAVEQGELQALAERTFSFATVLHNQSPSAQAWPSLELTLNDAADKPLLRRVITPRDYLPAATDLAKGFPPRAEQALKLYFELAQLKATGYHIAVFYP
jgi:predicted Zn finger-like uncharacterized protein